MYSYSLDSLEDTDSAIKKLTVVSFNRVKDEY